MIFHLAAAGTPDSWTVVALYKGSIGMAQKAAEAWYYDNIQVFPEARPDQPQFIVEVDGSDDKGWTVGRSKLWMDQYHLSHQTHDEPSHLLQAHTAVMPISDALADAVTAALKAALVKFGYMIPRAAFNQRYPEQVMISARFTEFNKAYDQANAEGRKLAFEDRWVPFMEAPKDHHFAYSTGFLMPDGRVEEHPKDPDARPIVVTRTTPDGFWTLFESEQLIAFPDIPYAKAAARLLNSGWTPEEVGVLLAKEAVSARG